MSKSSPEISVTISRDGPYIVTGGVPLATQTVIADGEGGSEAWAEGDPYQVPPRYALCRCGRSGKKPFCDGTHIKIGFDGSETASRDSYLDQARMFDGPSLALSDNERLCAFGRFCDSHGKIWNQVERSADPRRRQQFLRQVANCPAGRLVAWDKAKGTAIEPALPISIGLVEDPAQACSGPLWLRGGIAVISSDGYRYETRNRVTVCRCGASQNKPFCDGTHAAIGFRAN